MNIRDTYMQLRKSWGP